MLGANNFVDTNYDPNKLVDALLQKLNLRNDAALCRALEVPPPIISKIRNRRSPVSASMLIRMHEVTGFSISHLRGLMGDRRMRYRISDADGIANKVQSFQSIQNDSANANV